MNFLKIIFDPAILIIIITAFVIAYYTYSKFFGVYKNLSLFLSFLNKFKKSDLSYRFNEFDSTMLKFPFVSSIWQEFKSTLVFSESVALKKQNGNVDFQSVSQVVKNIQTTVDPLYFFNENSLVFSTYNSKFVGIAPTILTGMGPLFTFLNIAISFTKVDFSSQELTIASISSLMSGMQIAALCSVLAVSASLIFMVFEKIFYNKMCRTPLLQIQEKMSGLFDNVSSEKFLIELLKETKTYNNNLSGILNSIPEQLKSAFEQSVAKEVVPYMENLLYGLNILNEQVKKLSLNKANNDNIDDVDKLF